MIPDYKLSDPHDHDEYFSPVTISLGELVDAGFVKSDDPDWHWDAYDDAQYKRLNHMIEEHFWTRDIAIVPPGAWKREFLRTMNEIMPKYKILYKALDDGADPIAVSDTYGKSRTIGSEYPDTMLQGNSDYATNGTDYEYETITRDTSATNFMSIHRDFMSIDQMILEDIEPLFSCLFSLSLNGF